MNNNSDIKISDAIQSHVEMMGKAVLEIGCGHGRISTHLVKMTGQLTAIDPDKKRIQTAKDCVPEAIFQVGSGEKLRFNNNSFDFVIFTLSLHHQNSGKALREAKRVLKPHGKVVVVEPLPSGEIEQVFSFLTDENKSKHDAQKAICDSSLNLEKEVPVAAEWFFSDRDDLLKSIFEYYEMSYDKRKSSDVVRFLGSKIEEAPIVIDDSMILQVLS